MHNRFGEDAAGDWPRNLYRKPPTELSLAPLPIDPRILDACAPAALRLGGPKMTRLGVTSTLRGEGRTTVALAMAAVQSRAFGRNALLIDADFENPSLGGAFGLEDKPGLAEVVTGEMGIDRAIHEVGEGVSLLPAGVATRRRSRMVRELLSSDILGELAGLYEVTVVDLPPLLGTTDGPLLASKFDKALLVVRAQVTPIDQIREAVSMLSTQPYILVNGVRPSTPGWVRRVVDQG